MIEVLNMFNAVVAKKTVINTSCIDIGVVTDFDVTSTLRSLLTSKFKPLPVRTLFGREERLTSTPLELITKQLLNYIETYGLGMPGLFNLEVTEGVIITPTFVQAITVQELSDKVRDLLYANRPIKDSAELLAIIKHYSISFDFDLIQNNEMRIALYDSKKHTFASGDEAVRYLVYRTTGDTMVIKNKRKIEAIKASSIEPSFFIKNQEHLSQVFNRFKPLILAAKNRNTKNAINKIARMSKKNHVPVYEGLNKRFLATALKNMNDLPKLVSKIDVRSKFKILNLIEYKLLGLTTDVFMIRNGTVHIAKARKVEDTNNLNAISSAILDSLKIDLAHLKGKKILLDANVQYGLPISRKQTLGNLPFGTTVTLDGEISSGVYWENGWGANDLDLSTVDTNGNRTGWGRSSGYGQSDVIFSGDMTYADPSAMEFMTSKVSAYGLFVNVYSGLPDSSFELVVGQGGKDQWISDVKVREKSTLTGKGSIIGFVNGTQFTVYQGKLNDRIANFNEANPVIQKALAGTWTISDILVATEIDFDTEAKEENYDFNLSYNTFSIDKLEEMVYS